MQINLLNIYNIYPVKKQQRTIPLRIAPLKYDTVSFSGNQRVKKSDFEGIDLATIEKYGVDISKFRSSNDLQDWATDKVKIISEKDYSGRQEETKIQRKALLKEWSDYVTKENDAYTPVMQLAILDAVTKDLKPNTDVIPPCLNKGVLADTMCEVMNKLGNNPKDNININKLYQTKLFNAYAPTNDDGKPQIDYTGWIVIPSKINDPENFEANVEKLKVLSHRNWCTKSLNAEPYLRDGDFHVYLENGYPKLGVRFIDDYIQEIQGEINNNKIPQKYLETVEQYIKQNKFKLDSSAENEIIVAEKVKNTIKEVKNRLGENTIKESNPEVILPYFGITVNKDSDEKLIINYYRQPTSQFTYEDLGVDENKLLENVKEVRKDMCLIDSKATNIESLERVDGILRCDGRSDLSLNNLKYVSYAHFENTKNIGLENLEEVGNSAHFENTENLNLPNFKKSRIYTDFTGSKIKVLDSLKEAGGLILTGSSIESMKNLETVGSNLFLNKTIKTLPKLKEVRGNIRNLESDIALEDMPKLERIGESIEINCPNLEKLNSLKYIGGSLTVQNNAGIEELNNLEDIGKNLTIKNKNIISMPKLKNVGGNFRINGIQISNPNEYEKFVKDNLIY